MCLQKRKLVLTHNVQDVVGYLSGSDGALFGVSLKDLEHGLQLVQSAVLTFLADEFSTHRLKNTHNLHFPSPTFPPLQALFFASFLISLFSLSSFLSSTLATSRPAHRALSQSGGGLLDVVDSGQVKSCQSSGDVAADSDSVTALIPGHFC